MKQNRFHNATLPHFGWMRPSPREPWRRVSTGYCWRDTFIRLKLAAGGGDPDLLVLPVGEYPPGWQRPRVRGNHMIDTIRKVIGDLRDMLVHLDTCLTEAEADGRSLPTLPAAVCLVELDRAREKVSKTAGRLIDQARRRANEGPDLPFDMPPAG